MPSQAVSLSYRLGGDDGVSVEARKWTDALRTLGFEVRRVAGRIEDGGDPSDVELPGLALDAVEPLDPLSVQRAIDGADLVVVENVCSLPINLGAARATAEATAHHRGRVVFRHHDLPWQRRAHRATEAEFPPRHDGALHATINLRSRRELEARGYRNTVTIHNYFDFDPPPGDRDAIRRQFGFDDDTFVLLQPARAIERKNVPGGLRFAQRLRQLAPDLVLSYWLSGPAEDGYQATLDRLIARAPVPVTLGRAPTAADAYAGADLVVFPSTWEGFGNPVVESITYRRPCAAYPYPVLAEIIATGVRVFSTERADQIAKFLREDVATRERYYEVNVHRARLSFDIAQLPAAIERALAR